MHLVFEKVEIFNLEADLMRIGLSIGDTLKLQMDDDGHCDAYYTPKGPCQNKRPSPTAC